MTPMAVGTGDGETPLETGELVPELPGIVLSALPWTGSLWHALWNVLWRLAALFGMWTVMRQFLHCCQGQPAAGLEEDSDPEEADRDRRGVTRAEIAEENAFLQNHINELDARIAVLEEENHMLQSIQGQMVHQYAQAMRLLPPEQQRAILAESDDESD